MHLSAQHTSRRLKDSAVSAESTITGNAWPSSMISQRPGTTSTASMPATIACEHQHRTSRGAVRPSYVMLRVE